MTTRILTFERRPTCEERRAAARARRICLFGAAPDTGNLGVSALARSVLCAIADRDPHAVVTVFDHGRGVRYARVPGHDGSITVRRCGAVHTRRFWRPECLAEIRAAAWIGGLRNAAARTIRRADLVLDASGGDSFSDLYGHHRFRAIVLPKLIALEQRRPLVLLPQTYGPFRNRRSRRLAERIVRAAHAAWARDRASFAVLRDLLGDDFHPDRHRCGVDLAFGLPTEAIPPAAQVAGGVPAGWLDGAEGSAPLVGVNVSGLLYNDARAAARYGLRADYRRIMHRLLERLLDESDARVMLVPHVRPPAAGGECDRRACRAVASAAGGARSDRLAVLDGPDDPAAMKWLIGRCDWFCGTRLHAAIAAMSGGVPAAAIAYSDKTAGVFETCGLQAHVADPRRATTEEIVDRLWRSWTLRDTARTSLSARRPEVLRAATAPFDVLLGDPARRFEAPEESSRRRAA